MPLKALKTSFYQSFRYILLKRFTKRLLKRFTKILAIFSLFTPKSTSDRQKSFLLKKNLDLYSTKTQKFFFKVPKSKKYFFSTIKKYFPQKLFNNVYLYIRRKNAYLYIRSNYI
jgi:hypothetical protein